MEVIERLRAAPPERQLLAVIAAGAVLIAALAGGYFGFVRKPYDVLFENLRPADASTVIAELDKRKVPYRLRDGGAAILVPSDLADSVRLNLGAETLPLKGMVGFELFNKSDMGLTEFAQRINYQRALQGELARTIMGIDAVESARVHLSLSEPTIFRDDRRPPRASISITKRAGRELYPATVLGIQNLVAAAVPNLAPGDVVVVDQHGTVVSRAEPNGEAASPEREARQAVEQFYAAKVREQIQARLPSTDVKVTAHAVETEESVGFDLSPPREFGLRIGVSVGTPLDPSLEQELQELAGAAIGYDTALGDFVSVAPLMIAPTTTPSIAANSAPLPQSRSEPTPLALDLSKAVTTLALIALGPLLVIAVMLTRRRWTRRMSQADRAALVRNLRRNIAEEAEHASSF